MNLSSLSFEVYTKEAKLKYPRLSLDEEISLYEKIKTGDESAKEKLILSNSWAAVLEARRALRNSMRGHRINPDKYYGMLEDLAQEGVIGLIQALKKYDPSKGFKFVTYATPYIKNNIKKSITEINNRYFFLPTERNSHNNLDLIPEEEYPSPEFGVLVEERYEELEKALKKLDSVQEKVIRLRYKRPDKVMPFKEIAAEIKKTKQRAEQVDKESIQKLKAHFLKPRRLEILLN